MKWTLGLNKSWLSWKDIKERAITVREHESKGKKVTIAVFFGLSAIFFIAVGGIHAERAANAGSINKAYRYMTEYTGDALNPYDSCELPYY